MKAITFNNSASQRIYDEYIKRCRKALATLPDKDSEESLLEINSYIYEYMQHHEQSDETESLRNILERLGPPEEILKEVIAAKKIDQAVKTFNLKHLVQALFLNISNGVVYIILSLLTLLLASFPVMIILKLLYPADTGYFSSGGQHSFGFIRGEKGTEVLGHWFIPLMLVCFAALYCIIILLLKLVHKPGKKILPPNN